MKARRRPQGIRFSQSEHEKLIRLAEATTGGNQSRVVRALVIWATPETVKRALAETRQAEGKR